jgi:hypothetical protein
MTQFIGNPPSVNAEFWNRIAKREPFFARSRENRIAKPAIPREPA